jgi:hypothetical protein
MLAVPFRVFLLVVNRDLDFVRSIGLPNEADAILIVDPDAMLTASIPLQGLQTISGRDTQIAQMDRRLNLIQLAARDSLNPCPAPVRACFKEFPGVGIMEALNHLRSLYNVLRYT